MSRKLQKPILGDIVYIKDEPWPFKKDQFSIISKHTQTEIFWPRDQSSLKEPIPLLRFSANADQGVIFDAYEADLANRREAEPARESESANAESVAETSFGAGLLLDDGGEDSGGVSNAGDHLYFREGAKLGERTVKQMGRMLNQNNHGEIAEDFKYWNDPSDKYKQEGNFCPLWTYDCTSSLQDQERRDPTKPKKKKKAQSVTSMDFNPSYNDLFAVSIGSLAFGHSGNGRILVFSFKNQLEPEYDLETSSGALRVRFCPTRPNLLAFSCYDGSVGVSDIAKKTEMVSTYTTVGRHLGPCWDVTWNPTRAGEEEPQMVSSGTDGRVVLWTVTPLQHFICNEICKLHSSYTVQETLKADEPLAKENLLDKATAIEFFPLLDEGERHEGGFLVGTEEGWVHVCNVRHRNKQSQAKFRAHSNLVRKMTWNYFNPRVLLTVGGDWCICIWKINAIKICPKPCITIQLNTFICDAAWTPYCSTGIAVAAADREVMFFNLTSSIQHPVKTQVVVGKKSIISSLHFSTRDPVILAGSSRGRVSVMKLSPNLRKQWTCESLAKKKSAADKERERANLEREKELEEAKLTAEKAALKRMLAQEEPFAINLIKDEEPEEQPPRESRVSVMTL